MAGAQPDRYARLKTLYRRFREGPLSKGGEEEGDASRPWKTTVERGDLSSRRACRRWLTKT